MIADNMVRLIVAKKLNDVLNNGAPHAAFLTHLTERVICELHDSLAQFNTREEVEELVRTEIIENRWSLYYHLCMIVTNNLDPALAMNVAHMALCHVAEMQDDGDALDRVYEWLSVEMTVETRAKMMTTYSKTDAYLEYESEFDKVANDMSLETAMDLMEKLSELYNLCESRLFMLHGST